MPYLGTIAELTIDEKLDQLVDLPQRRALAYYLYRGASSMEFMGTEVDVLDGQPILRPTSLLGDGMWTWEGTTYHYVEKYGVELPDEFMTRAQEHNYLPPAEPTLTELEEPPSADDETQSSRITRLDSFSEFGLGAQANSSLCSLVESPTDSDVARDLAFYLLSCETITREIETTIDVLDGTPTLLTSSIKSDGSAIWREDLSHYVLKYRVGLEWERASRVHGVRLTESQRLSAASEAAAYT